MTVNPSIFTDARSIDSLPITFIFDEATGTYSAFYTDLTGLIVQVKDKEQAREQLRDLLIVWIKSICKR